MVAARDDGYRDVTVPMVIRVRSGIRVTEG
jgi:hypothetical protein